MPPRRTTRKAAAPVSLQSKLSFHGNQNKITKSASTAQDEKALKKDPAVVEAIVRNHIKTEDVDEVALRLQQPTTAEKAIAQQAEAEAETLDAHPDPILESQEDSVVKTEDVLGGRAATSDVGAVGGATNSGWVGDEEQRARKISEPQIKKYWRAKEAERLAPRVHQEDLSVHEKILREWDMSGQYGPCIGIARLKRWKRANMLGLQPPIEVLAVLLREMDEGATKSQRAHVDELLSSKFVET